MTKLTATVEGMMCGMCEAHVNEAVRKAFRVDKVTASHTKNEVVVLSKEPIDEQKFRDTIKATGYTVGDVKSEPYEKKGFFSIFKK